VAFAENLARVRQGRALAYRLLMFVDMNAVRTNPNHAPIHPESVRRALRRIEAFLLLSDLPSTDLAPARALVTDVSRILSVVPTATAIDQPWALAARAAGHLVIAASAVIPFADEPARQAFLDRVEVARYADLPAAARQYVRPLSALLRHPALVGRDVHAPQLVVDERTMRLDGRVRLSLAHRPVLFRVLLAILDGTSSSPVTTNAIAQAAWGEWGTKSVAYRVQQSVFRLRRIGLGDLIRADRRGYWLACRVERVPAPSTEAAAPIAMARPAAPFAAHA
jgi:hypothetical protein